MSLVTRKPVFRVFDQVRLKHERINLKENISSMFRKKKCFGFVLKKIFWLSDCEKKKFAFLSEENLEKKKQPPPPPENQMVGP